MTALLLEHTIALRGESDTEGFRRAARRMLAHEVPPDAIDWRVDDDPSTSSLGPSTDQGVDGAAAGADAGDPTPELKVPAFFPPLCSHVALHADPQRFTLLYRLLWRLRNEPTLRADPLDTDRLRAEAMARVVRRDMHKMKAFVRFRVVEASGDAGDVLHVAWFEPDHHIVEATAPFFARRFTQMRWALLTPRRCVRWDGRQLEFSAGADRRDAPLPDAGEALWLTYYQHIFNPARLKLAAMTREMPRRYWPNLPEATLIAPLADEAARRTATMIEQPTTSPARRLPIMAMTQEPTFVPAAILSLADVAKATQHCRECPLGAFATQAVPGEGPAKARLMLVGEQPGDHEDLRGRPFVGPAGQLLDHALGQLGWSREQVYVTNAVKHFKYELRGKRRIHKTPSQREAAACLHWLEDEIALVQPDAIVALGATAARSLMGRAVAVTKERGQWQMRADGRPVLITLHPSALLRTLPEQRDKAIAAWIDDLRHAQDHAKPR